MRVHVQKFVFKSLVFVVCALLSISALNAAYSYFNGRQIATRVAQILYADFTQMYECHEELLGGQRSLCQIPNHLTDTAIMFNLNHPDELVAFALTGLRAEMLSPRPSQARVSHYMSIIVLYNETHTQQVA